MAGFAGHPDICTAVGRQAADVAQAQPGAFGAGGEEIGEDGVDVFRLDPLAGVAHADQDAHFFQVGIFVQGGVHRDGAPAGRQAVQGVTDKIVEDSPQTDGIGQDRRQIGRRSVHPCNPMQRIFLILLRRRFQPLCCR